MLALEGPNTTGPLVVGTMTEETRDAYECPDGYFEVRDGESPHSWIACKNPVTVQR